MVEALAGVPKNHICVYFLDSLDLYSSESWNLSVKTNHPPGSGCVRGEGHVQNT
jgi:hypothetical protein